MNRKNQNPSVAAVASSRAWGWFYFFAGRARALP
jgi:hypothetical protein